LKAVIPSFDGSEAHYNSKVVCFTESPIFALDFFRYRSYKRWDTDQQYGIGFFKKDLIKHRNVRPVLYLDSETNTQLLQFCNSIIGDSYTITDSNGEGINKKALFEKIKPLLFPMLEETSLQGFMWEREWRCPRQDGMDFLHKSIKIICCPSGERQEIIDILGDLASNIEIVESWKEYDDVTNYLKRREKEANMAIPTEINKIHDIDILNDLKTHNDRTLNTLEGYYGVFKETVNSMEQNNINEMIDEMKLNSSKLDRQIEIVNEELKKQKEKKDKK
jgi:hypothetical protein